MSKTKTPTANNRNAGVVRSARRLGGKKSFKPVSAPKDLESDSDQSEAELQGASHGKTGKVAESDSDAESHSSNGSSQSRQSVRLRERRAEKRPLSPIEEEDDQISSRASRFAGQVGSPTQLDEFAHSSDDDAGANNDDEEVPFMNDSVDGYGAEVVDLINLDESEMFGEEEEAAAEEEEDDGEVNASSLTVDTLDASTISTQLRTFDYSEGGTNWHAPSKFEWRDEEKGKSRPLEVTSVYMTLMVEGQKTSKAATLQKSFVNQLFTLVAVHVMDGIATKVSTVHKKELWALCETRFDECFHNMHKKKYEQEELFHLLVDAEENPLHSVKGPHAWPACFATYCKDLYKPTTKEGKASVGMTWAKKEARLRDLNDEDKMKAFVGKKVHETYTEAKGQISMHLAKQWIPPHEIHSGFTIEYVFKEIRRTLWRMEAYKRAKNNLKQAMSRKKAGKAEEEPEEEAEEESVKSKKKSGMSTVSEAEIEARAESNLNNFDFSWYPDYWLTFVLYSVPAGPHCLLSMNGGTPALATVHPLATATQAATSAKRGARQMHSPGGTLLGTAATPASSVLSPNAQIASAAHKGRDKIRKELQALQAQDRAEQGVGGTKEVYEHKVIFCGSESEEKLGKITLMKEYIKMLQDRLQEEEQREYEQVDGLRVEGIKRQITDAKEKLLQLYQEQLGLPSV